jgi:C-terminal processing protease CtpA/Prc
MNMRLDLDAPDTMRTLRKEDILAVIKTLVDLRDGKGGSTTSTISATAACVRSAS